MLMMYVEFPIMLRLQALKTYVSPVLNIPVSIHRKASSCRQCYIKKSGILRLYKAWVEGNNINLSSQDFLGLGRAFPDLCIYLAL